MPSAIVYEYFGRLEVAFVAPHLQPASVAADIVPPAAQWRVVDADSLPTDSAYREAWTANFDDQPCVVTVDPNKVAAADKVLALAEVEEWFRSAIGEGFKAEGGIRLGLTDADVALLTGNYVLAKEAASLGLPLPQVIGMDGTAHTFASINDLTALMLAYGQYRSQLSAEYAAKKAELED